MTFMTVVSYDVLSGFAFEVLGSCVLEVVSFGGIVPNICSRGARRKTFENTS